MARAIKSTAVDRAVDFTRAADAYKQAAELIASANSLMVHHGLSVAYGESVAESVQSWADRAQRQADENVAAARRG